MSAERERIASLYRRLDDERDTVSARYATTLRQDAGTTPEARWNREATVNRLSARLRALNASEHGLCFGRIDPAEGAGGNAAGEALGPAYIGRIGLSDPADDLMPMLLDWRAPAARPFYCATPAHPEGLSRRRHFRTRGRELVDLHDELLDADPDAASEVDPESAGSGPSRNSSAALLAALNLPRGERMRDIVATIQTEQDDIIRLGDAGVVVVEGGPGTGKTAVALHRIAYLLYTRRELLSRRGVLMVGPNPGFLGYIADVLPSLGETDVVFATPGELMPGHHTVVEDPPETRRIKGSAVMAEVIARAVADREEVPAEPIPLDLDDVTVPVDAELVEAARARARATGLTHNAARATFRAELLVGLTEHAVQAVGADWLHPLDSDELRTDLTEEMRLDLAASSRVDDLVDRLWPRLSPARLLTDLLASPQRLAEAAPMLSAAERAALVRPADQPLTVSDVPLLDEAAELLGHEAAADSEAERERRRQVEYARGVLDILTADEEEVLEEDLLRAADVIDSEALAERHEERDTRDLAERAAADREWTYGHIVVDEAQELSEMDWRLLMRRCPRHSMTIVGDLAQRRSPAGARSWAGVLHRYVGERWTFRRLSVNYRTPAEVMAVAAEVLAAVGADLRPPVSVRSTGVPPWIRRAEPAGLEAAVAKAVAGEAEHVGEGTVTVLAADPLGFDPGVPVLTPTEAKGLEFDAVVVVEPDRIVGADSRGAADLYVALTRATQRLGIVHTGETPIFFDSVKYCV